MSRKLSPAPPCLVLLTFLRLAAIALAQVQTGTISGTVRDTSGAVIPNATVAAKDLGTGTTRTVQTAPQGTYTIPGLPPGTYEVTVTNPNFQEYKQQVQVTVGGHNTIDATMGLKGATTTVEVTAQEAGIEVNTQTQEISQIITPQQVAQLPSLTRNPYDFVAVAGNISGGDRTPTAGNPQTTGGGQNNTDRGVGYSLNGQRSSGTEILLDGVENMNIFDTTIALIIPQDAVREFRVVTNNFDAQYGRASGGVVNVSTKSGTNNFHGSAWEFNRLGNYTANTYDNSANNFPKGQYTRNQFGYTFGGPLIKDKLFFFQSTEWLRVRSNASLTGLVPTPQLLAASSPAVQAFFSQYGGPVTFSSTIPKEQLNFNSGGPFDAAIPAGTPVFGLVNYTAPADAGGDVPQNTYDLVGRVDFNPTGATQMFFRYGRENLFRSGFDFQQPVPAV